MDAEERKYGLQRNPFDGNAARRLMTLPEYGDTEEEYQVKPERRVIKKVRRKPVKKQGLDIFSLLFLSLAIGITLYTCVDYLQVQAMITQKNDQITKLERNLLKTQNENKAALAQIDTSLDLNYIYQVATGELGMVYPSEEQVIPYESNLSDYVKQNGVIPEAKSSSILDKIKK